jgi:heme oxygenase
MASLFERLKAGTQQDHREIEALIDPMSNFASLDAYKAHLIKTWGIYQPLEAGLAALDWTAVGIDLVAREKTPLLDEDMRFLGISHVQPDDNKPTLDRANLDFALGCLYVLEGATLGGQVISTYLAKLGIGPENGGRFFNGYGKRTGEMWKSFQATATDYCVTEAQMAEAVSGAKSTFRIFRDAMSQKEHFIHAS